MIEALVRHCLGSQQFVDVLLLKQQWRPAPSVPTMRSEPLLILLLICF